jgi:hypothetical protein
MASADWSQSLHPMRSWQPECGVTLASTVGMDATRNQHISSTSNTGRTFCPCTKVAGTPYRGKQILVVGIFFYSGSGVASLNFGPSLGQETLRLGVEGCGLFGHLRVRRRRLLMLLGALLSLFDALLSLLGALALLLGALVPLPICMTVGRVVFHVCILHANWLAPFFLGVLGLGKTVAGAETITKTSAKGLNAGHI